MTTRDDKVRDHLTAMKESERYEQSMLVPDDEKDEFCQLKFRKSVPNGAMTIWFKDEIMLIRKLVNYDCYTVKRIKDEYQFREAVRALNCDEDLKEKLLRIVTMRDLW